MNSCSVLSLSVTLLAIAHFSPSAAAALVQPSAKLLNRELNGAPKPTSNASIPPTLGSGDRSLDSELLYQEPTAPDLTAPEPTDLELAQLPPSLEPQPEPQLPPPLPPPADLLPSPPPDTTPEPPGEVPATLLIERFEVRGSTVFSPEELAEVTAPFTNRPLSFAELLQARSAITQLYIDADYVTSGAIIPPQTLSGDVRVVIIEVVEGQLEDINISGNRRLNASYIRDRLAIAAGPPLNVRQLLEGLQLLQIDPLIRSISADLQAGTRLGTNILEVQVVEADSFNTALSVDNGRSPSVGSVRRQIELNQANLLGLGDGLSIGYTHTTGSDGLDLSYTLPVNPRNGTLRFVLGLTDSTVVEEPFDVLQIQSDSRYLELTYRQPIVQTPTEELAVGITASQQQSQTEIGLGDLGPFPLSRGADREGRTRVTALRFFQEWSKRSSRQVLAARSQFSVGLDLFGATVNSAAPDGRFVAWRGQGQWVRLLAPDTLLLVRGDVQLADSELLSLEQFGLGGQSSVRGYRQDFNLADSGLLLSGELRIPVLRVPEVNGLLQVAPFIDAGTTWNFGADPVNPTLIGVGVGLLWRMDDLTARLDVGFPLVSPDSSSRDSTLQEDGIYFSINYSPF